MEQFLPELFSTILKQGPLAALLFFILYIANSERKAFREKTDQLNEEIRERLLKALTDTNASLKEIKDLLERVMDVLDRIGRNGR